MSNRMERSASLINDILARRPPKRAPWLDSILYHYTSQNGLIRLVESNSFTASNIHFLNDASEYKHAISVANTVIENRRRDDVDPVEKQFLASLPEALDRTSNISVYVFCFSEGRDVLSQWRGYSPNGSGYSLGFKYDDLAKRAESQGFFLAPCIYTWNEKILVMHDLLETATIQLKQIIAAGHPEVSKLIEEQAWAFATRFAGQAPLFKAMGFSEEKEWRLISHPKAINDPKIGIRQGGSYLVPYYRFNLIENDEELCLTEVIIGPTPHSELAMRGVSMLLSRHNIHNCTIHSSEIPFRNW